MSHSHLSRRGFLQSAAAALPGEPQPAEALPPFTPEAKPRRLSDNLFVLEDTCNVYLVRDGTRGLLIDFGSGSILKHLGDLGVSSIDWILHTHHHRDQAQGDPLAAARRIPIAVPAHERHLFEHVEDFWRTRRVYELYNVANDFFSLTRNVPVGTALRDYETFRWGPYSFFVQPTPGHTMGSITLLSKIDGRTVAFSGDLMHSPGKVQTLYDLQYYYGEHEGVDLSAYSLRQLIRLAPDLLCPSHGAEVPAPVPGMELLASRLADWFRFWHPNATLTDQHQPVELTPHVLSLHQTFSSFYAILSDSGKALFVDYGLPSMGMFRPFLDATGTRNRIRFIEHSIPQLKARYGLKSIDVAIPTHAHDDHLSGFPHLARHYGTQVWAYENMVEVLEKPNSRNVGCLLGEPVRVNRTLTNRERFRWEEYEFTIVHSPGHTNFQMALFATIDNARIAFTGDAFFADKPGELRHNLIYRNDVKSGDHLKSIRTILEFEPHLIAPGHDRPFLLERQTARAFEAKLQRQDAHFAALVADPDTDMGLDPSWVHISPYQAAARPGRPCSLEVRVRNPRRRPVAVRAALIAPPGWSVEPAVVRLAAGPGATVSAPVSVTPPAGAEPARMALPADVFADAKYLGQITEVIVEINGERS